MVSLPPPGGRVRSSVRGEPKLCTTGLVVSRSVYGTVPTRQSHSIPIAASGSVHNIKQTNPFDAVIHIKKNTKITYLVVYRLLPVEVATPENKSIHSTLHAVIQMRQKPASPAALSSRMQLTLHATSPTPHGASRLAEGAWRKEQAMSAWSGKKTGVLRPGIVGMRGVYGHTYVYGHA